MYSDQTSFPVYDNKYWHSDKWDPCEYGREIDFNRPLFEVWQELHDVVPHKARMLTHVENCDYCNNGSKNKDCYFTFNASHSERAMFSEGMWNTFKCHDCTQTKRSELCYDCVQCLNCYDLQSSQCCESCSESYYLLNCRSCKNCFACANLRHAEYCIFNKQYSKTEYFAEIEKLNLGSYKVRQLLQQKVLKFWQQHPRPHADFHLAENSSGDHLDNVKNVRESFFVSNGEDLRFCFNLDENSRDCQDHSLFGRNVELVYEGVRCGISSYRLAFCTHCVDGCSNLYYCGHCSITSDCFACVGLYKKKYCILNKQYSQQEYEALVPKLIAHMQKTGEWGEFFHAGMSAVPYNHSHANRYWELDRQEVESRGLGFEDYQYPKARDAIEARDLPDDIADVGEESIVCQSQEDSQVFLISAQEIRSLKERNAPLPRVPYISRLNSRARSMGMLTIFQRTCAKSGAAIETRFSPEEPWIVWKRDVYENYFSS
jgi:hypothetical protein